MDADLALFEVVDRSQWAQLGREEKVSLSHEEIDTLRGLGDPLDLTEVNEIYLPIIQFLNLYIDSAHKLAAAHDRFFQKVSPKVPFIIGVAGSVAVGKSTVARLLRALLQKEREKGAVQLVTTDGFLYPNAVLEERGIMARKGFPESYNQRALIEFLYEIKSGNLSVSAPFYSHTTYDIVPEKQIIVESPQILIVEGLNVLAPAGRTARDSSEPDNWLAISDFFDYSLYIDAEIDNISQWYTDRFLQLRSTAFTKPDSYFSKYATVTDREAQEIAYDIWTRINKPNLTQNIRPTRPRADMILSKGNNHRVEKVLLKKGS